MWNGNIAPRAGFVSSDKPQSAPYPTKSGVRGDSASRNVAQSSVAANSAESEVSQIHSVGIRMPLGKIAHSHAALAAAVRPETRLPTKKIGKQASAEKMQFSSAAT